MRKFLILLLLLGGLSQTFAQPFVHPGIPLTLDDLNYVKARLAVQPWKSGWDALQADGLASTNYIEEVRAAVKKWPHYAEQAQVMNAWRRQIQKNLRLNLSRT